MEQWKLDMKGKLLRKIPLLASLHPFPSALLFISLHQLNMPFRPPLPTHFESFPPLTPFTTDNTTHTWKVKNPTAVDPAGTPIKLSPAETVLNWQSQNVVAQNSCLQRIESQLGTRLQTHEDNLADLRAHINSLHHEILSCIQRKEDFSRQEQDINFLKTQLHSLEQSQPTDSLRPKSPPSQPPHPSPVTTGHSPTQRPRTTNPQDNPSTSSQPGGSTHFMMSSADSNPITDFLTHHTFQDPIPLHNLPIHYSAIGEDSSSSEESDETSSTESDSPIIFKNQSQPPPPAPQPQPEPVVEDPPNPMGTTEPPYTPFYPHYIPPSSGPWFNLDDHHPSKWRMKIHEIYTRAQTELIKPNATLLAVFEAIVARFMGILKQWWNNLGPYRQRQVIEVQSPEQFIGFILKEFIGDSQNRIDQLREEFFKLKCCSFDRKDLQTHFQRASLRFYEIGGPDDPNIKQAYLSSIPDSLSQETQRLIEQHGLTLASVTFGHLGQLIEKALQGLCNKWNFMHQFKQTGQKIEKSCYRPDLLLKCSHKTSSCDCPTKKKKHFRKF
ncbi:hypothetical protein Patl1_18553 [Pistacia atlantica]|uniref:Uncharacterized protein n=1 Tax=Pistacia atlantica TaxID=434234 RepID=A0ACC1C2H5_9ROSI|nr:hypothetical protein Patl1_18553 [Pistacia atlantica]